MLEVTPIQILKIINECIENKTILNTQIDEDLSQLGIDSIEFIQMIVLFEEKFCCEFPDTKLVFSKLNTIKKLQRN